jgi:hypothetical protein
MSPTNTASEIALSFAAALDEKFAPLHTGEVSVVPGRTFDRIVIIEPVDHERNLIGFIRRSNSDLIEPRGWASPKSDAVRFKLANPAQFAAAVNAADSEGTFLQIH